MQQQPQQALRLSLQQTASMAGSNHRPQPLRCSATIESGPWRPATATANFSCACAGQPRPLSDQCHPTSRLHVGRSQAAKRYSSTNGVCRTQKQYQQQPHVMGHKQQGKKRACIRQQMPTSPPPFLLQDRTLQVPLPPASLLLLLKSRLQPLVLQHVLQFLPALLRLCQNRLIVALIKRKRRFVRMEGNSPMVFAVGVPIAI